MYLNTSSSYGIKKEDDEEEEEEEEEKKVIEIPEVKDEDDEDEVQSYNSSKQPKKKQLKVSDIQDLLDDPTPVMTDHGKQCRACKKGYFTKKDSKLVNVIAKLVKDYAFAISPDHLINEIWIVGEVEREAMIKKGEGDPGEWTKEEIQTHLFECMQDPALMALKQILVLKKEMHKVEKRLWQLDPDSGEKVINEKAFKLFFALQHQLKTFHSFAPEKSIGFNPKLNVHSKLRKATV
jgi:hypothetical protein